VPRERDYRDVWYEFLDDAPIRGAVRHELPVSAAVAWRALADVSSWGGWVPGTNRFEWTSEPPHGVGSTRRLEERAGTIAERFVAWEPERRMAFVVTDGTVPLWDALVEEYTLEPRGERSHVVWRYGFDLPERARFLRPAAGRLASLAGRRLLRSLARWLDEHGQRYAEATP
jgi:hypothetical protein